MKRQFYIVAIGEALLVFAFSVALSGCHLHPSAANRQSFSAICPTGTPVRPSKCV
jgi:hypothetical protein